MGVLRADHSMRAPPAKEKNDRKNEVAAKAMERPNTTCTMRRKAPPMSPNDRLRPVTMMTTTAITLATGPSIDSRIRCSGASHGMPEPAACAALQVARRAAAQSADVLARFREI